MQNVEQTATGIKSTTAPKKPLTARMRRTIDALVNCYPSGKIKREALDRISGSSNSPDQIFKLRRDHIGYDGVDCQMSQGIDRDGKPCVIGLYSLTELGYQRVIQKGLLHNG